MTYDLIHFATSSGLGALGFNLYSFVVQLITFILAYLVLRKWAFGPIIRILRERKDVIDKGVKLGEEMKKEKELLEAKIESELAKARSKADSILSTAQESAKEAIRKSEQEAQARAETILKESKAMTEQEMSRAKRKLESELSQLVVDATEALTREKVSGDKDKVLINNALREQVQ